MYPCHLMVFIGCRRGFWWWVWFRHQDWTYLLSWRMVHGWRWPALMVQRWGESWGGNRFGNVCRARYWCRAPHALISGNNQKFQEAVLLNLFPLLLEGGIFLQKLLKESSSSNQKLLLHLPCRHKFWYPCINNTFDHKCPSRSSLFSISSVWRGIIMSV